MTIVALPLFLFCYKILPAITKNINPKLEIYSNDKSSTFNRSMIWLVATLIALVGAIAAIIAILPKSD
jgi:hypothetical protein